MKKLSSYTLISEGFDYPGTGANAQPEVKKAIDRWRKLSEEERQNQPLLYWLLGAGTPEYKMSKKDSQYTDKSKVANQKCANCQFAYMSNSGGNFICSKISGDIQLPGWCKLFVKANNPKFDE